MYGITIIQNNVEINLYCDDSYTEPEWRFNHSFDHCQSCFNTFDSFDAAFEAAKQSVAEWKKYYDDLGIGGDVPFLEPIPEHGWNGISQDINDF
jgi:hypothetical protein